MRESRVCDVWVCDYAECGYSWLATSEVAPEKCPGCKKRRWNQNRSTVELIRSATGSSGLSVEDVEEIARRIVREELEGSKVQPPPQLCVSDSVEGRKAAVLASLGRLGVATLAQAEADPELLLPIEPAASLPAISVTPCTYTEPDLETGNIYGCSLTLGHKGPHKRGEKISEIW